MYFHQASVPLLLQRGTWEPQTRTACETSCYLYCAKMHDQQRHCLLKLPKSLFCLRCSYIAQQDSYGIGAFIKWPKFIFSLKHWYIYIAQQDSYSMRAFIKWPKSIFCLKCWHIYSSAGFLQYESFHRTTKIYIFPKLLVNCSTGFSSMRAFIKWKQSIYFA